MFELKKGKNIGAFIAAISIALLTGCATQAQKNGAAGAEQGPTAAELYVWRVEQTARHQNVDVVWINPPTRDQRIKDDRGSEKDSRP